MCADCTRGPRHRPRWMFHRCVKLRVGLAFVALVLLFSPFFVTAQTQPNSGVAWILLVDDLHLDFRITGRIRDLARAVLNELVREGDVVAIRTSGPSTVLTDFSSRQQLLPFVSNLTGGGLRPTEILTIGKSLVPNELSTRTRLTLSAATTAVALLGQVESERRALIYISNGHPFDTDTFTEGRALAGLAERDRVKIFAIEAAGLDPAPSGPAVSGPDWDAHRAATRKSLEVLAERAGGFAILDAVDMRAALQRISDSVRP